MPFHTVSDRTIRYEKRCFKKQIDEQKVQRATRYEQRCSSKNINIDEVKNEVKKELKDKQRIHYEMRERPKNLRYGPFGCMF
jgi:hypothetical protein